MTSCPNHPDGRHDWRPAAPETASGSTLLTCAHQCGEVAYRIREVAS